MYKQIEEFFENKLSKKLCGFRKKYSTQVALIKLFENWQSSLDKNEIVGTVLMDLSKAYDSIRHDLLIAKLSAYGFSQKAIHFMYSYLTRRKQRVKIYNEFSSWLEITFGIPQGSILGPLLFNIFLNDIFLFIEHTEICNFADDNTIYSCNKDINLVINNLKADIINLTNWFKENSLVANPKKFQVMFLGTNDTKSIHIGDIEIKGADNIELLGLSIDKKLKFHNHINKLCNPANKKLSAINRLRYAISPPQVKILIESHILSYFFYCPLIWMFLNKKEINKINKIHKRSLRILSNDFRETFENLLALYNSDKIHIRHLRILMIEIYKIINNQSPEILTNIFQIKETKYNMRDNLILKLPQVKTSKHGINSIFFKGAIIWNTLPLNIKSSNSLGIFKTLIKTWNGISCSCKICNKNQ